MHPRQIRIGFAVTTLAVTLSAPKAANAQGMPLPGVVVSPVVEREVTASQVFVGTVMPLRKAIVGSAVDGRVVEFPHNEGDRVEQGEPLAQLLTDTIKLEIDTAEAELNLRKEQLAELENGTRPEEVEQAKARMLAAEARMKYAALRQVRSNKLFGAGGAMSEEERDEMHAMAVEEEQKYLDLKAAHQLAVQGPRKEQIAQARAQVAMMEANVNRLKDQLTKHTVIARFSGYVTAEHTEVGQWVKQGDPVAEIAALDEVEVNAYVVEHYAPHVRAGMQVKIEVPALAGRSFSGIVSAIVPQADVQARTFPVKVRVKNELTAEGPMIKSGMYIRVLLPTGSTQQAMLVPKDALVLGGAQTMVCVVDGAADAKSGKIRSVPVSTGVAEGNLIQVTGDTKPGDLVVVQGNERLRPGQDVMIQRVIEPQAAAAPPAPRRPVAEAKLR